MEYKHRTFISSLSAALRGVWLVVRSGGNFRRELAVFAIVLAAAALLGLSVGSIVLIVFVSAVVLAFEALNSALEHLEDIVQPRHHEHIQYSKDIAASAVLIMSVAAVIVGIFVFAPHLVALFVG